jgi:hypothetical protein
MGTAMDRDVLRASVTGCPANSVRDVVGDATRDHTRFHQWLAELGNALLASQGILPLCTIERKTSGIAQQQADIPRSALPM